MKTYLLILYLFIPLLSYSQGKINRPSTTNQKIQYEIFDDKPSDGTYRVKNTYELYGLINTNGDLILPVEYDWIEGMHEGVSSVRKGENYALINNKGKFVTGFDYDGMGVCYEDRLYVYKKDNNGKNKYGFLDKQGKLVIPMIYDDLAMDWNDPYSQLIFVNGHIRVKLNEETFLIDREGNRVN